MIGSVGKREWVHTVSSASPDEAMRDAFKFDRSKSNTMSPKKDGILIYSVHVARDCDIKYRGESNRAEKAAIALMRRRKPLAKAKLKWTVKKIDRQLEANFKVDVLDADGRIVDPVLRDMAFKMFMASIDNRPDKSSLQGKWTIILSFFVDGRGRKNMCLRPYRQREDEGMEGHGAITFLMPAGF